MYTIVRGNKVVECGLYEDFLILVLTDVEFYDLPCAKPSRNIQFDLTELWPTKWAFPPSLAFVLGKMEGINDALLEG